MPRPPSPTGFRVAAVLQGMGGILCLPFFLSFIQGDIHEWKVHGQPSGDLHRALFYAAAPLALVLAPFLWARRRWAWWGSLVIAPFYAIGPWTDLTTLRSSLHGGEVGILLVGLMGAAGAALIATLLWRNRGAINA